MKSVSIRRWVSVVTLAVSSLLAVPVAANAAVVSPSHPICDDVQTYKITSHSYSHLVQTVPTVQLVNKGKTTATLSTGVTITGSVSMTVSGNITTEESIIIASAKEQLGASVTVTLSGSWDVHASMSVRPGKVGYIKGGIFRVQTIGTYTHLDELCRTTKATVTSYMPYHYGYITSGG
jgi:hypothetical protein